MKGFWSVSTDSLNMVSYVDMDDLWDTESDYRTI